MLLLGATIGIPMGLAAFGPTYVIPLLIAGSVALFGFIKHKYIWGQVSAILGTVLWIVLGAIGLGTGT